MIIHPRSAWGAKPGRPLPKDKPERIVVHHSFSRNNRPVPDEMRIVFVQTKHMDWLEWNDIGYHYIVGPTGQAYAGRDPLTRGAHCGSRPKRKGVIQKFGNKGSLGILCLGNFDIDIPDPLQILATQDLIKKLMIDYKISEKEVYGHCEVWSEPPKTCPGKNLFTRIFPASRWPYAK